MRVLIGCERSGIVRRAFRARGHDAYSCDTHPALDGEDCYHLQGDVLEFLDYAWDIGIFHPDCTYLTNSAEWAYGDGPYHQKVEEGTLVGAERRDARVRAVEFAKRLWAAPIKRIALENPVGHLSQVFGSPQQIIQPNLFGDDASKGTCLWLKNLPPLETKPPSARALPRLVDKPGGIGRRPRWGNQTDSGQNRLSPSEDRWAERSYTYPGIAEAFAEQWGNPARLALGQLALFA